MLSQRSYRRRHVSRGALLSTPVRKRIHRRPAFKFKIYKKKEEKKEPEPKKKEEPKKEPEPKKKGEPKKEPEPKKK